MSAWRKDAIIARTAGMLLDPLHPPGRLLEVAHIAHRLCVSQEFVRRLIRERKLTAIRLGRRWRVEAEALQAFIDAQRVQIAEHERALDRVFDLPPRRRQPPTKEIA